MQTSLEFALAYAKQFGWKVFPAHTIIRGQCSCKKPDCHQAGKHPIAKLVPRGHNDASSDEATIRAWWGAHPEANIGIATGEASGIVVIDVDDAEAIPNASLPDTIEQITGRGGRHVIYKRPADAMRYITNTNTGGILGIDSRADGGYIIASPSLHRSGKRYEWEGSSNPFEGAQIADAPEWWLDLIRSAQPLEAQAIKPVGDINGLPDDIEYLLDAIKSYDYQTWITVGLALNHADPTGGLAWWDWWASHAEKYDSKQNATEWSRFASKKMLTKHPVTIETIYKLADMHGYIDPKIGEADAIIASLEKGAQEKITDLLLSSTILKKPKEICAPDIMPPKGIIKEIANYIISTARWPQPDLAVANTIAFLGAVMGRKYRTQFDGYSNIYVVGLLDSGGGKDHSRKTITKIAVAAGASDFIGGENFASGTSIISALQRHPSQVFQIDEFGKFVSAVTSSKAALHQADIVTKLMSLYSSANGVYQGTEYADQKLNPRTIIQRPCACVYGTATPSSFWSGLSSAESVDGFLSRLIIVDAANGYREKLQTPSLAPIPQNIIEFVSALAEIDFGGGNLESDPLTIEMTHEVIADIDRLEHELTKLMQTSADKSIFSRVVEQALKLAMIYSVSLNIHEPVINAEAWTYGREFALYAANLVAARVIDTIADSHFESSCKAAFVAIKSASGGLSANELSLRCAKYKSLKSRERQEVIQALVEDGLIQLIVQPGKTKSTKIFIAI